jgi:hypothetical protein
MAKESTENSTSSEQSQSSENITVPPISKPAAGAAAGAVLGSVAGPVGAVVGGVIGAIAGKSAATGGTDCRDREKSDWFAPTCALQSKAAASCASAQETGGI